MHYREIVGSIPFPLKSLKRQSERDFPRGATRNGIVDGTKCQASERRGNLFSLTCIVHTKDGLVPQGVLGDG